jgi:hypothetical protein
MKNYIRQWPFFICLCIPIITAARTLKGPNYLPSSDYTLGLGVAGVLPYGTIFAGPLKKDGVHTTHNYKLYLHTTYALVDFKKSYLSLVGNISYSPTSLYLKKIDLKLENDHIRFCPGLGFTTISNKYFYVLQTTWLGYEWDVIFNSTLKQNDIVFTEWPSTDWMGNIVFGSHTEFFYGIYIDFNVNFPLTKFIHLMDKVEEYDKNGLLENKAGEWKEVLSIASGLTTCSLYEIGLGVNILSLIYPPQVSKR